MVRLDGPNDAEDDLNLILKFDAANLCQKQSSHVGVWGGAMLSPVLRVGRTRLLECLGSNESSLHTPPL